MLITSVCECVEDDFSARASGELRARQLVVEGTCVCPRAGHTLRLEPGNPGINPDPTELVLRLVIDAPEVGPTVMTRTPVRYEATVGPERERVVIRVPDQPAITLPIIGDGDGYEASAS
jgi:hypothetical protein